MHGKNQVYGCYSEQMKGFSVRHNDVTSIMEFRNLLIFFIINMNSDRK